MKRYKAIPVNEDLRKYATEMRKNPTGEERKIWCAFLKHLKPDFHRQRIIGNYIVDFYCPKLNLVIEIDGSQHYLNKEYDEKRTEYLENEGFTVLRFDNADVNYDFKYVVFKVRETFERKANELCVEFIDTTLD